MDHGHDASESGESGRGGAGGRLRDYADLRYWVGTGVACVRDQDDLHRRDAGRVRGRPHRHRRPQRRRQIHVAAPVQRHAGTRFGPCDQAWGAELRHARPTRSARRQRHRAPGRIGGTRGLRVGVGDALARDRGGVARRHQSGCAHRLAVRWPAPPRRSGPPAAQGLGHPGAGRADQPSGRGHDPLVGRTPENPLGQGAGRVAAGDARPLVPGRGVRVDVGGARRHDRPVRGRLQRVHAAACGTRPAGRRARGPPPQPGAQGVGVAEPRRPRALHQAEVPRQAGTRADRRRAAAAQHAGTEADGDLPSGQAGGGSDRCDAGVRRRERRDRRRHAASRCRAAGVHGRRRHCRCRRDRPGCGRDGGLRVPRGRGASNVCGAAGVRRRRVGS